MSVMPLCQFTIVAFCELCSREHLDYDHNQVIYDLPWEAKFGFPFWG